MEHLLHIFGGGCGEHLLLPGLAALGTTLGVYRLRLMALWSRLRGSSQPPRG